MMPVFRQLVLLLILLPLTLHAAPRMVNVYAWTGEVPDFVVRSFEKETGIKVHLSTYGNNEIMYAKLRASPRSQYDVIMPTSYFVDRMSRQQMLAPLDKSKLSNWHNLSPDFINPTYDPHSQYSVPFLWGITGIFYNKTDYPKGGITKWSNLWETRFHNQLLMLDDLREMFSIALLSLGYSANDKNREHIEAAFQHLQKLMPNVKVFSTDTVVSIVIDEDATVGAMWNGDAYKAMTENSQIHFVFPQEGFVIWVDNFSIPKNAPHPAEAYAFIDYILRPEVAKAISLTTSYPTANLTAQTLLPSKIRHNPTVYPPKSVMKRGQFQLDLGEDTLALLETYWEELKMNG